MIWEPIDIELAVAREIRLMQNEIVKRLSERNTGTDPTPEEMEAVRYGKTDMAR